MMRISELVKIEENTLVNLQKTVPSSLDTKVLAEMDIIGDVSIKVELNVGSGSLLISVRNTNVIIGRKLASKILVEVDRLDDELM